MNNRKNRTDRREPLAKEWALIMADVKSHVNTANRVDKGLVDLRAIVNRLSSMSTTKG
jgi:hypothetical protein